MKKSRHEYKFQIDEKDIVLLRARIGGVMRKDSHVTEQGYYHIRSIYFDDIADTCYTQNEAGTDPRAKYRIRIYNASDASIRLEKKVKQNGMTRKYSVPLTREQAEILIAGKLLSMDAEMFESYPELLKQFLILMKTRHMQPKVMVVYDRVPYVDPRGNVRVTFDRNIAASTDYSRFFEQDLMKEPILPTGIHLMEVKYDEYLPAYIKSRLDIGHLRQTTFSKYYLCRKRKKI
ncbi:MAG: polyphosphate polymerase domain-containing protein [Lachnospiraceae bacterium]|nr:polyphosphate polymerase domain-containing protein [Lachnospiraceae bacterium]